MILNKTAKNSLINKFKEYEPFDEAEKIELERFINFLENNSNVYSRNNLTGHLTSSSWIINKDKTKALLIHHNIYNCWAPLGGHADEETDLSCVAIKESQEESGIKNIKLLKEDIIDITIMTVNEHEKRGKTVPKHFHFDVRYLLEADDTKDLILAEQEVSDVKWFNLKEVPNLNIDIMTTIKRVIKKVQKINDSSV